MLTRMRVICRPYRCYAWFATDGSSLDCRLHGHMQGREYAWTIITLIHLHAVRCRVCGCSSEAFPRFREAALELPRTPSAKSVLGFREVAHFPFRLGFIPKRYILVNFREVVGAFRKEAVRSFGTARLNACPDVSLAHRDNDSESHVAIHTAISFIGECSCVRPKALGRLKGQLCDYAIAKCSSSLSAVIPCLFPVVGSVTGTAVQATFSNSSRKGGSLPGRLGTSESPFASRCGFPQLSCTLQDL